jgi:NAD(P)-dependent dehydrogenase (short-subunit alcohol dehydrogenase family)
MAGMVSGRPAIVVTGGSRGIGTATVQALAGAGYDVALGYRRDAAVAERVVAQATASRARCVAVQADVTREEDVERLFGSAAQLGPVAGLVSNAGLTAGAPGSSIPRSTPPRAGPTVLGPPPSAFHWGAPPGLMRSPRRSCGCSAPRCTPRVP